MSSIEDVDVGEVDFSVEPMDVDANLSVISEEIISTGTYHTFILHITFFNNSCDKSYKVQLDTL